MQNVATESLSSVGNYHLSPALDGAVSEPSFGSCALLKDGTPLRTRKLLVALWKYVRFGVVIDGVVMKAA